MLLIPCPWCGPRPQTEFYYGGDASVARPALGSATVAGDPALVDYVYARDNPKGPHREYWQHTAGCRQWFVLIRDTHTHAILGSEKPDPGSRPPGRPQDPSS